LGKKTIYVLLFSFREHTDTRRELNKISYIDMKIRSKIILHMPGNPGSLESFIKNQEWWQTGNG
jgi:hypothetical protein